MCDAHLKLMQIIVLEINNPADKKMSAIFYGQENNNWKRANNHVLVVVIEKIPDFA